MPPPTPWSVLAHTRRQVNLKCPRLSRKHSAKAPTKLALCHFDFSKGLHSHVREGELILDLYERLLGIDTREVPTVEVKVPEQSDGWSCGLHTLSKFQASTYRFSNTS